MLKNKKLEFKIKIYFPLKFSVNSHFVEPVNYLKNEKLFSCNCFDHFAQF